MTNRPAILDALHEAKMQLSRLADRLERNDLEGLTEAMQAARNKRSEMF
jgi:prephenate dehydrogenase